MVQCTAVSVLRRLSTWNTCFHAQQFDDLDETRDAVELVSLSEDNELLRPEHVTSHAVVMHRVVPCGLVQSHAQAGDRACYSGWKSVWKA